MRIAFMGTPPFAVPTLAALHAAGHDIAAVYTQPPRPAQRGKKFQKSPVQVWAEEHALPVRTPKSLKGADEQAEFAALNLDIAVVAAYGLILPPAILDAPREGCLNVHGSILPRWRGAAPVQRAILAGDARDGRDDHADGRRARHRRDAVGRADPDRAQDRRGTDPRTRRDGRVDDAAGAERPPRLSAGAAARGRRHLRRQDRQERGAARFPGQRGAGRAADPRVQSGAGGVFRAGGRAVQDFGGRGCASGRDGRGGYPRRDA